MLDAIYSMQYHRTVLPNGLRVLTIPMPSFESATVMVVVGAGSRYETKENNGISHFLEHMAFKGTKKRPSALAIASLIDGIGGELNAFTGKEITGYYIKSSVNNIDLSMDVLSDMLQHSLFDPLEIDKERNVILEEINLYEDTPVRKITDIYERLLYGDTPMGWDTIGEKEVIQSIKRENFLSYLSSFYSADNIALIVAGGIKPQEVGELAQKYFSQMHKFDTLRYTSVVKNQSKSQILLKHKKTEQAHIALGVPTVPIDHPERYSLSVLAAILGGGMSSRLFHEIREKRGLAYYIRATSEHYQDCGSLVTLAGVDPKRLEEAISVILDEYHKVQSSKFKVQSSELKKVKEFLKGHLVLELEDSRDVAGFYCSQEILEKKIDNPDEVLLKIDRVTIEDIINVAKKYFLNQHLNLTIIGDFTDGQKFKKLLKL